MFIQHPVLQSIFNSDLSGTCYICSSNWSETVAMLETELKLRFSTRQRCCSYELYNEGIWELFFGRAVVYGRLLKLLLQ